MKLGEILLSHDRYDQAFEEYFTAYQRLVELEDTLPIIESLLGLGDIYLKQENYSKAFEHYVNARNLAIQRNLLTSIAWGKC